MKQKKIISVLVIICMLSAFLFIPWQVEAAQKLVLDHIVNDVQGEEEQEGIVLWKQKMQMQEEATQAYSELRSLFGISELGMDIFPDDYAGAWIEDDLLIVGLTSFESIEKYNDVLDGFDCVQYVEMQYSLNELYEIRDNMYEQIKDDIEISCFYVHVASNNIVYEVLEPVEMAEQKIGNKLAALRSSATANSDANFVMENNLFVIVEGNEVINQTDVYGGLKFKDGGGYASVGICGTIHSKEGNDYPGFITCGHGATVTGEDANVYIDDDIYGRTFLTMYYDNCYGDWVAVRKTSNSFTQTNKIYGISDYLCKITGTKDEVAPGTIVMKYGYKGKYCTGTVKENDITIKNNGIKITGMTSVSLISGVSKSGDSGGPYYISDGMGNYNFLGVHHGICTTDSEILYFTPYKCFKAWFTPDTN